ncbi:hypothetical protein, partial [Neisseria dentiae]|uniref:hypothetical protein n=1 Tax=Neisseria dentiae TaxID=194197 RepID=UPI00359F1E0E
IMNMARCGVMPQPSKRLSGCLKVFLFCWFCREIIRMEGGSDRFNETFAKPPDADAVQGVDHAASADLT